MYRIQGVNGTSLGDNSMRAYNCRWVLQQPQSKEAKSNSDPLETHVRITTPRKQPRSAEVLAKSEESLECVVEEEDDTYQLWPWDWL